MKKMLLVLGVSMLSLVGCATAQYTQEDLSEMRVIRDAVDTDYDKLMADEYTDFEAKMAKKTVLDVIDARILKIEVVLEEDE